MTDSQVVALVGNSLLTDSIEASLKARDSLWVVHVSVAAELPRVTGPFIPDVIIADLHVVGLTSVLDYLTLYPGVALLGVEARSECVTAFNCERFTIHTADDLAQVIRATTRPDAAAPTWSIAGQGRLPTDSTAILPRTVH